MLIMLGLLFNETAWDGTPCVVGNNVYVTQKTRDGIHIKHYTALPTAELVLEKEISLRVRGDFASPIDTQRFLVFESQDSPPFTSLSICSEREGILQSITVPRVKDAPYKDQCALFPKIPAAVVMQSFQRTEDPNPNVFVYEIANSHLSFKEPLELPLNLANDEDKCSFKLFYNKDHNWICLSSADGRPKVWHWTQGAFRSKPVPNLEWPRHTNGERRVASYYCDVSLDVKYLSSVVTYLNSESKTNICGIRIANLETGEIIYYANDLNINGLATCAFADPNHVLFRLGNRYSYLDLNAGIMQQLEVKSANLLASEFVLTTPSTVLLLGSQGKYAVDKIELR